MKKLQLTLIFLALFGMMHAVSAQRVVRVYPKHGTVVRTVYKPRVVVHKGTTFHLSDGVWYTSRNGSYIVTAAPRGVFIKRLPRGRKIVRVNGRKLYLYKGVYYQKKGRGFIVIDL